MSSVDGNLMFDKITVHIHLNYDCGEDPVVFLFIHVLICIYFSKENIILYCTDCPQALSPPSDDGAEFVPVSRFSLVNLNTYSFNCIPPTTGKLRIYLTE